MTSFFTIWEVRGSAGWNARCNAVSVRAIFYLLFPHITIEGTWRGVIKKFYTIRLGFQGALPGWDGLPAGGRPGARSGDRGCQLVDKVFSPALPHQRVKLHQDEAQHRPEAAFVANERFLLSLKFSCSGGAVPPRPVVKRGDCVLRVCGERQRLISQARKPEQATVQKAFGKIGQFSGAGDLVDFQAVDEAAQ